MKYIEKYWKAFVITFIVSAFIKPAFCMLMLGSLFFYRGIDTILLIKEIKQKGIECMGRIILFQADSDGYKTPLVEFTAIGGRVIKEAPFISSSTDLNKIRFYKNMIDKQVVVLYHPDNPKMFILSGEVGFNYFAYTFATLAGLTFIILGISSFLGFIPLTTLL